MNHINIGTTLQDISQHIDNHLHNIKYNVLSMSSAQNNISHIYFEDGVKALLTNEVDIFVLPLEDVSIHIKDYGVIIGALSQRKHLGSYLFIKDESVDLNEDLKVAAQSKIAVKSNLEKEQLEAINPKIQAILTDIKRIDFKKFAEQSQYDGLIMSKMMAIDLDIQIKNSLKVDLNPREFIPQPGSGVIAYLVHPESIKLREVLRNIHCKDSSDVTNIERKSWQLASKNGMKEFGAYCYKDIRNYYHLSVCQADGTLQKRKISLSTSNGLDELAISSFQN